MIPRLLFSLWLLGLLPASPAWSADAFTQTLLTRDASVEVQDAAIREAMRQMLLGLGAEPGVWLQPEFQALLAKAPLYVDRFSYPKKFNNPWPRPMTIRFDRQRLKPLLGNLEGGGVGPRVLLWLLQGQGDNYRLGTHDEANSPYIGVQGMADDTGIEVLLPRADMAERNGLVADQGELAANQSLLRLSEGYGAGAVLVGRLQSEAGVSVQAEWTLLHGGEARYWRLQGIDERQVVHQALIQTAAELGVVKSAPRTSVATATAMDLVVLGAGQGSAGRIADTLKKLSLVARVQPRGAVEAGQAFGLGVFGSADSLREALLISGLLEPAAAPAPRKKTPPRPAFDPLGDFQSAGSSSKPAAPATPVLYFRLR